MKTTLAAIRSHRPVKALCNFKLLGLAVVLIINLVSAIELAQVVMRKDCRMTEVSSSFLSFERAKSIGVTVEVRGGGGGGRDGR